MRVTNGNLVRRYVYDVRLGEERAVALYHGDTKLWPTLGDTVYSCVLDVNALYGSLLWAYWLHALDAIKWRCDGMCYIHLWAGGREYMLGSTFGKWNLAAYDSERATVVFGDNGPLWEKLQPGDEVLVSLQIPPRTSVEFDGTNVCYLPFISHTKLSVAWYKSKKRKWAGRSFCVAGSPSGTVHFGGSCETSMHKRLLYTRILPTNTHKWKDAVYNGAMVKGDTLLHIDSSALGSGIDGGVSLLWPGFTQSLKFKVSAVTRHG